MEWLPVFFMFIMGFSLLMYTILDGYDLGVGILFPLANDQEKDRMISSIGPFWDANETWIVLGVGVLLIAFPKAYGLVLTELYLPVTLMLMGLIVRGVAFDFRVKVSAEYKSLWNKLFFLGSLITSMCQGWMLGSYIMGLQHTTTALLFSIAIAFLLPVLYVMLGCGWLLIKTEGDLYNRVVKWAKIFVFPLGIGLFLVSIATPIASSTIADKWFSLPEAIGLLPIPVTSLVAYFTIIWTLNNKRVLNADYGWIVFVALIVLCVMCALGLAYSVFPDVVIGQLTIWETASSRDALLFTFYGTVIVVPAIFLYTAFIYKVFSGKATDLNYE